MPSFSTVKNKMRTSDAFYELSQGLKKTARSFYLSLLIFPPQVRKQFSVAYCFCKTADTIVDLDCFSQSDKKEVLLELFKAVTSSLSPDDFLKMVEVRSLSQYDELLFPGIKSAFSLFHQFASNDRENIREVLREVVLGMEIDLKGEPIKSEFELDQYCYYVAGSAGAFLTKTFYQYQLIGKDYPMMMELGIQLGKGLQLTNMIRDRIEDRERHRFYLPPGADFSSESVIYAKTLSCLENGLKYVISLPRFDWRIRLASYWPILFAIKTLSRLLKTSLPDSSQKIKISRSDIYKTMAISAILIFSNNGIRRYFGSIRKQINFSTGKRG